MLCSRFKQILFTKKTIKNKAQIHHFINARFLSKRYGIEGFWAFLTKHRKDLLKMSSVRFIFRDISLNRFWSAWTRSAVVGHVVRRCRKERGVREVVHYFRQAFLRPRCSLLLYATASCHAKDTEEKPGKPLSCSQGIRDEDLEGLLSDLEGVTELSMKTLYCLKCGQRLVIEKKQPRIKYCSCKEPQIPVASPDGWVPYMEAENVIIWRKEYKKGQGLYAYKVYGRYKDVQAEDYAAVNVDGAYRRQWDTAVAALSVVERNANGLPDQSVLHWEVLWPRLFANRDYVYIRRHKEFTVKSPPAPSIFDATPSPDPAAPYPGTPDPVNERPSVHDNAKRKSLENYSKTIHPGDKTNKVYVIVSRSCVHPDVPETRNAIRVSEYWSHMVIRTLNGDDEVGMEFVLTYYDEPAVGGMPLGVTAWATGRAAPLYLQRMRLAAKEYLAYKRGRKEDIPDYTPFRPETKKVHYGEEEEANVKEEDMESSKTGPEMDYAPTRNQSTQTDEPSHHPEEGGNHPEDGAKQHEDGGKQHEDGFKQPEDGGKHLKDGGKDPENGGDHPVNGGNYPENGGNHPENGGNHPENGGNHPEDGGNQPEDKGTNTRPYEKEELPTRPIRDDCDKAAENPEESDKGYTGWTRYLYPFYYFV